MTVYRDALGKPSPEATVSIFGNRYSDATNAWYSLNKVSDAPDRRWSGNTSAEQIVADLTAEGWECEVKRDSYGFAKIKCTHRETADELERTSIKLVGNGEPGYIRYGEPPASGYSTNHATGEREPGVSVYRATYYDNGYELDCPHYSQGTHIGVRSRKAYRVWGEVAGYGSDGEPCLRVTRIQAL